MKKSEEIIKIIIGETKAQGKKRSELAKQSGCTRRQIDYMFKGERGLSIDLADAVLKAVGKRIEIVPDKKAKD